MRINSWLEISYNDYVNHMSSPEVGQYKMINQKLYLSPDIPLEMALNYLVDF